MQVENGQLSAFERALMRRLNKSEIKDWVHDYAMPYKELMAYYRCALMEVETKFNVLNEELSLRYDRNPIESIKSRLKSPESIVDKAVRKGIPLTVDSIEKKPARYRGAARNLFISERYLYALRRAAASGRCRAD